MRTGIILSVVLGLQIGPLRAQAVTETFAAYVVSFDTPAGYHSVGRETPNPAAMFLGYETAPRADCSAGRVTIVLVDPRATAGGEAATLQQWSEEMISAVHESHADWAVSESRVVIAGDSAIRYSWSGSSKPPDGCQGGKSHLRKRGVMIVGLQQGIMYALQARDFEPYAAETVPAGETAMRSFHIEALP